MIKSALMSGVSSRFAAALGFAAAEEPKDDDKKDKGAAKPERKEGESDEDYSKRCEEEEKKNKAEGGTEDDPEASEDDDEEKKKDEAKKAEARGVLAERGRWTAVMSAPEAKNKGIVALSLLADTDLSADQIRATLKVTPEANKGGLYARMAAVAEATPKPGPGGAEAAKPGDAKSIADAIVRAGAKARGEKETKAA